MFVLVMGVGALKRYSFGVPPGHAIWLKPQTEDKVSADDLDAVAMTSLRFKRPAFAAIDIIMNYVSELILQPDIWEAVERVADHLLEGPLGGREVAQLCAGRTHTG